MTVKNPQHAKSKNVSQEQLDRIHYLSDDFERAQALIGLTQNASSNSLYRIFEEIIQLGDPAATQLAAMEIASLFESSNQFSKAATIAVDSMYSTNSGITLEYLLPSLSQNKQKSIARDLWSKVREPSGSYNRWSRAGAIRALAPQLDMEQCQELVSELTKETTLADSVLVLALSGLINYLPENQRIVQLNNILRISRGIQNSEERIWAQFVLLKLLPEKVALELLSDIVKTLEAFDNSKLRMKNSTLLIFHLPEYLREALKKRLEMIEDTDVRMELQLYIHKFLEAVTIDEHVAEKSDHVSKEGGIEPQAQQQVEITTRGDATVGAQNISQQFELPKAKEKFEKPSRPFVTKPDVEINHEEKTERPEAEEEYKLDTSLEYDAVVPHADNPAIEDQLNRLPFANLIAKTIESVWERRRTKVIKKVKQRVKIFDTGEHGPGSAYTIHIHGPWGSGKTSVLNFLGQRLIYGENYEEHSATKSRHNPKWVVINFNAWQHQHAGPPWWSLLHSLYRQGLEQLKQTKRLATYQLRFRGEWWRFRTGMGPYILLAAGLFWLAAMAAGTLDSEKSRKENQQAAAFVDEKQKELAAAEPRALSNIAAEQQNLSSERKNSEQATKTVLSSSSAKALKNILELWAIVLAIAGVLHSSIRSLMFGSSKAAANLLEVSKDPMRPITLQFRKLVNCIGLPVVVFIDDLDRCRSDYVVELLQGIQTFFRQSNVTYVVAADRNWMRACYENEYKDFLQHISEPGRPLGYLFMDKTFQVSTTIPSISPELQKQYMTQLIKRGGMKSAETAKEMENQMEAQAKEELGDTTSEEELMRKINIQTDIFLKRAMRNQAAQRVVTPEAKKEYEHVLEAYNTFVEPNPRAMKRLVNAYAFQRAINFLSERDVPQEPLVLWTIVQMRWPLLADALVSRAELAKFIGINTIPEDIEDSGLKILFNDEEVTRVFKGQAEGKKATLTPNSIRKIVGTERNNISAGVR